MPNVTEVTALLAQLNPLLFGPESRLTLRYVAVDALREQDVNANVMSQGMFSALTQNVQRHRHLESVPLCATREGSDVIEVVSGHHRTRAARAAGLTHVMVLVYAGLTASEIRAKQLAHNAIQGTSDPEIVRRIFEQIEGLSDQMESFIDPNAFAQLPEPVQFEQIDLDPFRDARVVTVVFLPTQLATFEGAVQRLDSQPDRVYLAARETFEGFKAAVQRVRVELEVFSYPTALAQMARLAVERLDQLATEQVAGSERSA